MMKFDYNYQNLFQFAFLIKFVNPAEVLKKLALICKRKQRTEGFW